jgi:hypothetical protein
LLNCVTCAFRLKHRLRHPALELSAVWQITEEAVSGPRDFQRVSLALDESIDERVFSVRGDVDGEREFLVERTIERRWRPPDDALGWRVAARQRMLTVAAGSSTALAVR